MRVIAFFYIEIAADFLGRIHAAKDVKILPIRECGNDMGKHALLIVRLLPVFSRRFRHHTQCRRCHIINNRFWLLLFIWNLAA